MLGPNEGPREVVGVDQSGPIASVQRELVNFEMIGKLVQFSGLIFKVNLNFGDPLVNALLEELFYVRD